MGNGIFITGGHIIDPSRGMDEISNVLISEEKIVLFREGGKNCANLVVNADGCLVLPGLIDFHSHAFFGGTDLGMFPDIGMLPNGVTTTVDAGSAGTSNYTSFHKNIIVNSVVRIKSFLHPAPTGLLTTKFYENHDPKYYDEDRITLLFRQYSCELLGLKVRLSKKIVGELGVEPLKKALEIAEHLSCPIVVHATDPAVYTQEWVELLRKGDIFAHVYHGRGNTIIGDDGRVIQAVKAARKRGVIFDAANGASNFSFQSAEAAICDGFLPDIISTDLSSGTMYQQPVFGLPWIMSKYLAMGIKLYDIVAACTATPAKIMGMSGEIGTLAPGACADVTLLKLVDHTCEFLDSEGDCRLGHKLLLPQVTIRAGRIVFRHLSFQ
jgi:predicted amidohydrolase